MSISSVGPTSQRPNPRWCGDDLISLERERITYGFHIFNVKLFLCLTFHISNHLLFESSGAVSFISTSATLTLLSRTDPGQSSTNSLRDAMVQRIKAEEALKKAEARVLRLQQKAHQAWRQVRPRRALPSSAGVCLHRTASSGSPCPTGGVLMCTRFRGSCRSCSMNWRSPAVGAWPSVSWTLRGGAWPLRRDNVRKLPTSKSGAQTWP